MKLWVDDVMPAPDEDYIWVKSVRDAIAVILQHESNVEFFSDQGYRMEHVGRLNLALRFAKLVQTHTIELIDTDHDAGEYAQYGGDYIKLLDWLEQTGRNYPIRIHSMNVVGVANMRAIIQKNGWKEV